MTRSLRNPEVEKIWLSALRAAGRKPATLSIYRYSVEQLLEWRQGDPDVGTLNSDPPTLRSLFLPNTSRTFR